MTDEELKEKIAGILKEAMKPIEYGGDIEHAPEVHYPTEDEIAYALIEAGIGDVKEAKRRAEVTERAVENLVRARNYLAAQIYLGVENGDALTVDYYMRQAEKQLAKEENDND